MTDGPKAYLKLLIRMLQVRRALRSLLTAGGGGRRGEGTGRDVRFTAREATDVVYFMLCYVMFTRSQVSRVGEGSEVGAAIP